jgi:hypothetical protein
MNMTSSIYHEFLGIMRDCQEILSTNPNQHEREEDLHYCEKAMRSLRLDHKKTKAAAEKALSGDQTAVIERLEETIKKAQHGLQKLEQHCSFCNQTALESNKTTDPTLKVCSRCKKVFYCSKECQRLDWPNHKKVCHM